VSTNVADGVAVVPPLIVTNGYVGIRKANPTVALDVSGTIQTASSVYADTLRAGSSGSFYWDSRTKLFGPVNGTFRVTDYTEIKDRFYLNGPAKALTAETETPLFYLKTAGTGPEGKGTNVFVGGTIDYTVHSTDATDGEVKSGIVTFEAVNPAGVWTNKIVEVGGTAGYTTAAWTMLPLTSYESTNIQVCVNVNPALTPAANRLIIFWQARLNSTNVVVVP